MDQCITNSQGIACLPQSTWINCRPWELSTDDKTGCYADDLSQEGLYIAGAPINVHKLLGIHEQLLLTDTTGNGVPISSGSQPHFPPANAFDKLSTVWKSSLTGSQLISKGFIGYDFGVVKLPNGRNRYTGDVAPVTKHITTLKIKQGSNANNRVTKVRIERSHDSKTWYGTSVVLLPNDDNLNTIHFKQSVPSRYWRLRPIETPGSVCDNWHVQALELIEYDATHISNIQDKVLFENRDRDYSMAPIQIKGYYPLQSSATNLSRFGIDISLTTYTITVNFTACVASLGRPIIIGDILELPSQTQFTPDLRPIKQYVEVTDVTWDPTSYTPGWRPTMLSITAKPALASQETRDIFGNVAQTTDVGGLVTTTTGNSESYQDNTNINQTIAVLAERDVPLRGAEGSNTVREFTQEDDALGLMQFPHVMKMGFNRTGLYVEDAIPQNGEKYTEGPILPTNAKQGEYHRLVYQGLAKDVPARLFRWSVAKNRWIYLETDRRTQYANQKARLEEYTTSANKKWANEVK